MTKLEPMHKNKIRDVKDMIRYFAQKEDDANPTIPPIPKFEVKKLTLSEAVKTAMRWDAYKFMCTFLP